MSNVQPGDLAIIVRSDFTENIGMLVRVVGPSETKLYAWRVDTIGRPGVCGSHITGIRVAGKCTIADDCCLRRIDPLGDEGDVPTAAERERERT